jgi:ABC-type multidrug transport system fused ATPase/permease subunit
MNKRVLQSYKNIAAYLSSLEAFRRNFFVTVSLSLVASASGLSYPYVFGRIVADFHERKAAAFVLFVCALVLLQIVQTSLTSWTSLIRREFDLFANRPIILRFYNKVLSLPMAIFKRFMHTGEIYQRVIDSLELNQIVADVVTRIALITFRLAVLIAVIAWLNVTVGVLVLCLVAIYYLLNRVIAPRARKYQEATLLSNSPLTTALFDGLNKIRTIKALGAKDQVMKGVSEKLEDNIQQQLRFIRFSAIIGLINGNVSHVLKGGLILYVAWSAMVGHTEMSVGLSLIFLILQVFDPLQNLIELFVSISRSLVILERYYGVLDNPNESVEATNSDIIDVRTSCPVSFESVSFSYGGEDVLREISLHIPAGKRVALVGRSGSGKSTIMNLLLGLYRPREGRVLVNGTDLANVELNSFRKQVGVVLQEEYIFPGTLRENVTFGLGREVDDSTITAALKAADLWSRFANTSDGLQSLLREGSLSGGELQRLILARAFLRNPALLVFDEPTSSMDMETEARIQASMDRLLKDRTSLTIAHRLSTIMKSDLIYVIDNGRVVESGNHEELVRKSGHYFHLYQQSLVA